jgi:CelD/BcsL family acetyltransferase involved in cellulose biosynthesis
VPREHVVVDGSELDPLVPAWRELWRRCRAPVFQHPAWALAWRRTASHCVGHALVDEGRLVALVVVSEVGGRSYVLGHPLNDGNEILAQDDEAARAVLEPAASAAAHRRAPLVLEHLRPEGMTAGLLRRAERVSVAWLEGEPSPVLQAGAVPSTRLASRLERERRRFGPTLRCARPSAEAVEEFVRRRLAHWTRAGRIDELPAVERDRSFPAVLGEACGALADERLCHLASLTVDDRVVAEDLYLGRREAPLLYMRRYERSCRLSSPGLHLAVAVRGERGIGDIDLGRGLEDYKRRLGATAATLMTAQVSPAGP